MTKESSISHQPERNKDIYFMRKKGCLLKEIAYKYDISIARVCEIFKKIERQEEFKAMWNDPKNLHKTFTVTKTHTIQTETRFFPMIWWDGSIVKTNSKDDKKVMAVVVEKFK